MHSDVKRNTTENVMTLIIMVTSMLGRVRFYTTIILLTVNKSKHSRTIQLEMRCVDTEICICVRSQSKTSIIYIHTLDFC